MRRPHCDLTRTSSRAADTYTTHAVENRGNNWRDFGDFGRAGQQWAGEKKRKATRRRHLSKEQDKAVIGLVHQSAYNSWDRRSIGWQALQAPTLLELVICVATGGSNTPLFHCRRQTVLRPSDPGYLNSAHPVCPVASFSCPFACRAYPLGSSPTDLARCGHRLRRICRHK